VDLHTTFGEGRQTKTIPIRYPVVDAHTSYNMLLGRPSLNSLGAIVSIPHLALKFPSASGDILTIHDNQKAARECYLASLKLPYPPLTTNNIEKITAQTATTLQAIDLDPRINNESRIEPVGETKPLALGQPDLYLQIGTTIESQGERESSRYPQTKLRSLRLDSGRPSKSQPQSCRTQTLRVRRSQTSLLKEKKARRRTEISDQIRSRKTHKGRIRRRSTVHHLDGQRRSG